MPGKVSFVSWDAYIAAQETPEKYVVIDCSTDSMDGKKKADVEYNSQRVAGALYLDLNKWMDKTTKPMSHKRPKLDEFKPHLQSLGIGAESNVLVYDNNDGNNASRGAFLLTAFGVKKVAILNAKFTGHVTDKSKITNTLKATGADFNFEMKTNVYAESAEIKKIVDGTSTTQLIDVRPEASWKKSNIPKSKNMPYTSVFANHMVLDGDKIMAAFKAHNIDHESAMIFMGGLGAYSARAVCDSQGFKGHVKVFDMTADDWIKANPKKEEKKEEPKKDGETAPATKEVPAKNEEDTK